MLSLGRDPLSVIVAAVAKSDLFPFALTCTTVRNECIRRSDQMGTTNGPRWHTHGTSSVERVKWAVNVMGATPNEHWCESAAMHGCLPALQWLRENDCPWGATMPYAAEGGHVHVLQWARQNGCPWDARTCSDAALHGHFETVKWARQNGCPWDEKTCSDAARNGHFEILKWARQNGCPWDKDYCLSSSTTHDTSKWIESQPK